MVETVSYHGAMRVGGFRTVGGLAQRLASGMAKGRGTSIARLRVAGSAALEVQHMREQLIDRVNAYFGRRTIDDIKLVQGAIAERPLPRPPTAPATLPRR